MINTYCPLIYHQMMIDYAGNVSACCQFEASTTYDNYNEMMKSYRAAIANGEKIKPCRRCWDDESKGFPSLRQSAITDFKRYSNPDGLMILDIRINNNCNLACTMCSDHASSLWSKLTNSNNTTQLDQSLQNELIANSKNLIKLSIQGGEPFYGDEFINFVERLPNKSNMQLEIFSNTITADIDILKKWVKEFQQVSFISSVDGIENTFESIRWPASWDKFERKIKMLYKVKGLGLSFNFTLQNLNILNIGEFIVWRNKTVPKCKTTISVLEWPTHFHFTVLTKEEKEQALKIIENIKSVYAFEMDILKTVAQQLQTSTLNEKLLQVKNQQLEHIKTLRERYLVRPERLELSTPSTSS
jgi:uncharacterized Fe-S cluster-containing radical SAM superfamily protein